MKTVLKELGITLATYVVIRGTMKGVEKAFDMYDINTIKKKQEKTKEAGYEDYVVVQDGKEFCVIL